MNVLFTIYLFVYLFIYLLFIYYKKLAPINVDADNPKIFRMCWQAGNPRDLMA